MRCIFLEVQNQFCQPKIYTVVSFLSSWIYIFAQPDRPVASWRDGTRRYNGKFFPYCSSSAQSGQPLTAVEVRSLSLHDFDAMAAAAFKTPVGIGASVFMA